MSADVDYMMYLKAIASAAAGFVLARLLVGVGAAIIGGDVGYELLALHTVAWVAMSGLVAHTWTQVESRRETVAVDAAEPQVVQG